MEREAVGARGVLKKSSEKPSSLRMARVEVTSRELRAAVEITIAGSADVATAAILKERLLVALASDRDVVVRLDGIERLDGAGVQLLLAAHALITRAGRSFAVPTLSDPALRALETAGATVLLAPR
jgi:anti-anti-sigma factor